MHDMNTLEWIAMVLLIIGGLNWGLVGLFSLDLVEAVLGAVPTLQTIVYVLVGLSALDMLYFIFKK